MKAPSWIDGYAVKARLYPALLALSVPVATLVTLDTVTTETLVSVYGLCGTVGVSFGLAELTRRLGKRFEQANYRYWDGPPTTRYLRHRDTTIDTITKARYHRFLCASLGQALPSAAEEARDPVHADQAYQSAVGWLRENTRDKDRFPLVAHENVVYGYHRQCQALKWIAVSLSTLSCMAILYVNDIIGFGSIHLKNYGKLDDREWLTISLCLFSILVWTLYFSLSRVKASADTYADALLRGCDLLPTREVSPGRIALL